MTTQHCLDCASENSCVNCGACSSLTDRRDVWWFEAICAFWEWERDRERERERGDSHAVCDIVSHKLSKLLYKLFNEEIWIAQDYNYFTSTGQSQTVPLHVLSILSRQARHQLEIYFLRSAFLKTADQTSPSDYRPIVIGNRSIGAPLNLKNSFFFFFFHTMKVNGVQNNNGPHWFSLNGQKNENAEEGQSYGFGISRE